MKKSALLLLFLLPCARALQAQISHLDSVTAIAKADAKNFILDKDDLKKFRRLGPNRSKSDLFKPKAANVSATRLLQDSAYVEAYRHTAFVKTRKMHTAGHYILIFGSIAVGLVLIISVVLVLSQGVVV
jgi:hypothetical protein